MIIGTHALIYSKNANADRAFLRDVLGFSHVDAGGGWLIFALPPAEIGVHPSAENGAHAVSFMTDNIEDEIARLRAAGIACTAPEDRRFGLVSEMTLPGGGQIQIYQPLHPLAIKS